MTRFVHLTYTSLPPEPGAAGGWRFKQDTGSTPAERERAQAEVPTALDPPYPLSRFPGPDELAGLPLRMAWVAGDDDQPGFLVHSVAAGPDATLRPGNVFSQVLIDRELPVRLAGEDPVRPIEYWRSPAWLTPYGPDAVRSAQVDEAASPEHGTVLNRSSVNGFLKDARTPVNRITELLDATAAALAGGVKVVLIADDLDDAARWIGLVSFLASPQTAARLTFSTYERTAELLAGGARSMLSVVLTGDFYDPAAEHVTAADGQDRLVFLDLSPEADVVRYGPAVSPCDWSAMVVELYDESEQTIRHRLEVMDTVSRDYPTAAAACPWWPLAVTMARTDSSDEARRLAAAVILRNTPDKFELDPDLSRTVRELLDKADRETLLTVLGDREQRVSANLALLDMAFEAVAGEVPGAAVNDATAHPVLEAVIAEIDKRGQEHPSWSISALVLLDQLMQSSGLAYSGRWHGEVADALARVVCRDPSLPDSFEGRLHEKTRQRVATVTTGGAQQCR